MEDHNIDPKPCGQYSLRGIRTDGTRITVKVYCNRWDCPTCARRNKIKYFHRYDIVTHKTKPIDRITKLQFIGTREQLKDIFNRYNLRVKRAFGEFERASFVTPTSGVFEIVMATRGAIPGKLLRRMWESLDKSCKMVWSHIVSYKDFSKFFDYMEQLDNVPVRFRVIRTSRGFFVPPEKSVGSGFKWWFSPHSIAAYLSKDKQCGGTPRWMKNAPGYAAMVDCEGCETKCVEHERLQMMKWNEMLPSLRGVIAA